VKNSIDYNRCGWLPRLNSIADGWSYKNYKCSRSVRDTSNIGTVVERWKASARNATYTSWRS